jgi:hypothetical protein
VVLKAARDTLQPGTPRDPDLPRKCCQGHPCNRGHPATPIYRANAARDTLQPDKCRLAAPQKVNFVFILTPQDVRGG